MKKFQVDYELIERHVFLVDAESADEAEEIINTTPQDFRYPDETVGYITAIKDCDIGISEQKDMSAFDMISLMDIMRRYLEADADYLETSAFYENLKQAGADDEAIEMLGFGWCIMSDIEQGEGE